MDEFRDGFVSGTILKAFNKMLYEVSLSLLLIRGIANSSIL